MVSSSVLCCFLISLTSSSHCDSFDLSLRNAVDLEALDLSCSLTLSSYRYRVYRVVHVECYNAGISTSNWSICTSLSLSLRCDSLVLSFSSRDAYLTKHTGRIQYCNT